MIRVSVVKFPSFSEIVEVSEGATIADAVSTALGEDFPLSSYVIKLNGAEAEADAELSDGDAIVLTKATVSGA